MQGQVEIDQLQFDIVNVSAGGLLLESIDGVAAEAIASWKNTTLKLKVIDPRCGSYLNIDGRWIRSVVTPLEGKIMQVGLSFIPKV